MGARLVVAAAIGLCLGAAAFAGAEVTQRKGLRVNFDGKLSPKTLPRASNAPVRVAVEARIAPTEGAPPPQLRRITIAINRHGRFETKGLPVCHLDQLQPSTTADARRACGRSLVGSGHFGADVLSHDQTPFPSDGRLYAFNGVYRGKPAIFAHVYGEDPVPISYTIPFVLSRSRGTFGTILAATLPGATSGSGYVTELSMDLGRNFSYRGERRSYVSAACPAPSGVKLVSFPFARAGFNFGKREVTSTLTRSCRARG
jgi:hypothetical protein